MKVNEVKILCSRTMKAGEKFGEFVKAEVTLTAQLTDNDASEDNLGACIEGLRKHVRDETDETCKSLLV